MGLRDRIKRGARRAVRDVGGRILEAGGGGRNAPAPQKAPEPPRPTIPEHILAPTPAPEPVAESLPEPEPVPEPVPEPEVEAAPAESVPLMDSAEAGPIEKGVVEAIKTVFDPEIPVNIYELGLIYDVDVLEGGSVHVRMTLTSPNCPAAQSLPAEVKEKSAAVDGVSGATVDVVWEPPWDPTMMSEAARLELNIM